MRRWPARRLGRQLGDHLGSTSLTLDAAGNVAGRLRYTPFGRTRDTAGSVPTTYRFTGQREDSGIGLYFYNARYYDVYLTHYSLITLVVGYGWGKASGMRQLVEWLIDVGIVEGPQKPKSRCTITCCGRTCRMYAIDLKIRTLGNGKPPKRQ